MPKAKKQAKDKIDAATRKEYQEKTVQIVREAFELGNVVVLCAKGKEETAACAQGSPIEVFGAMAMLGKMTEKTPNEGSHVSVAAEA